MRIHSTTVYTASTDVDVAVVDIAAVSVFSGRHILLAKHHLELIKRWLSSINGSYSKSKNDENLEYQSEC